VAVWSDAELHRDAVLFRLLMFLHVANGLSDGFCIIPTQNSNIDWACALFRPKQATQKSQEISLWVAKALYDSGKAR